MRPGSGPARSPTRPRFPVAATFEPVDTGLRLVDTYDVCFAGYGGHPIRGWLHLRRSATPPTPSRPARLILAS
jgi:cephalosporin-C deacetylase-like acetyl esterase